MSDQEPSGGPPPVQPLPGTPQQPPVWPAPGPVYPPPGQPWGTQPTPQVSPGQQYTQQPCPQQTSAQQPYPQQPPAGTVPQQYPPPYVAQAGPTQPTYPTDPAQQPPYPQPYPAQYAAQPGPAPDQSRPAAEPAYRPPDPPRRRRWPAVVALAVAIAMIGAGVLAIPLLTNRARTGTGAAPAPSAAGTPPVTVTPSPQPTAQTVLTTGGDLGEAAAFTTATGAGTITLTKATWTQAGRMAPPAGKQYLIVEATITCTSGELDLSSLSLRTTSDPSAQSGFGPQLDNQFPGVRLTAGNQQSGQVGFVLAPGEVTIAVLDPSLKPVAARRVPGP